LKTKGYEPQDRADEKRKLHDLYCAKTDTWFECKTDRDNFLERLLVEVFANVPSVPVPYYLHRQNLNFGEWVKRLSPLADTPKYHALGMDRQNLEPRHLLSYAWRFGGIVLVDIRELRRQLARNCYDWIVCGDGGRIVASLVPLKDCRLL
jgi:hypothetical protein